MTDVATDGAGGTTHAGLSDCVNAMTDGIEIDPGAASPGPSARRTALAPSALMRTFALGVASDVSVAFGLIGSDVRGRTGKDGTDGRGAGSWTTCWSIGVCTDRSTSDTCAGTITT